MQEYTLKRTGKRPVKFTGELLASGETSPNNAHPDYSGATGIWHKAAVYKTDKGRYVLEYVIYTAWQGQEDSYLVHVADDLSIILDILEDDVNTRVAAMLFRELQHVEDIAERL